MSTRGIAKKTWSVINELRGKRKNTIKPQFIINNERITNRRIISNEFNKYFVNLASKMNDSISETGMSGTETPVPFTDFLPKSICNSIFLSDCTSDEISKIIANFENGKSSDIPIKIVKSSSHLISPILANHFNSLMKAGQFPNELKIGKITPVFKKDNDELLENYRPVSTLPIFGKIFEKVIYERLYNFLISQQIINSNQFGFRKGHSTSHALNYSINHIQKATGSKEYILGIFIDLSKAFDTIDHKILLHKLEQYGIRGNAHALLKSYLTNRQQYTSVLGENSEKAYVQYGVPQGSILGPLLFLVYINDILNCSGLGIFILFADDTNIFVSAKTKYDAYRKANLILRAVSNYMTANKLHVNTKKCCYMLFKPKCSKNESKNCINDEIESLTLNGVEIVEVQKTKFLGVIIDNQLSWGPHLEYINKKLKCSIGLLCRIKNNLPTSLHKSIYHTLFESHLSYGITVWGGVSQNKLLPIFKTQKKCMRILFGDTAAYLDKFKTCVRSRAYSSQLLGPEFYIKEHSKPLFTKHEILTLHHLYHYYIIIGTFNILKTHTPISLYSCFTLSKRKALLLIAPNHSHNFVYKASALWNKINTTEMFRGMNGLSANIGYFK